MINTRTAVGHFLFSQLYKKDKKRGRTVQDSPSKTVKKTRNNTRFQVEKIAGSVLGFMLKILSNPYPSRISHFISPL